jgi:PPOX class probable F420-dependent enzyme
MEIDEADALERLRAARVARLATVTPDGRPHVVPFVFAVVEQPQLRIYWAVDAKPKRSPDLKRLENIAHNPAVEFVVDGYDEDWAELWWIRVAGTARTLEPGIEWDTALAALVSKYGQYAASPPPGPIVAIDAPRVRSWNASADP